MRSILQSLFFSLLVSSGAAFFWPADSFGFDPFSVPRWWLWTLITVTMICLGALVRPQELEPLKSKPWWVILGVATQMVAMPLAAWTVTRLIPMDAQLAAGVILVGCVPGAMASNVLTHTAGGSVAYSVSLTTVATLLSPLSVPAVLSLFAVEVDAAMLNPGKTSLLLFLTVVVPTITGYVTTRWSSAAEQLASRWAAVIASISLLWIIASVVAGNRDTLSSVGIGLLVALLTVNFVGYSAGYLVGRGSGLPSVFRRALTLEVGMQNAGLGTALAATLYGQGTQATIPTAAYTFGCMLTGTILAVIWRRFPTSGSASTGPNRPSGSDHD
ncbi:MAG: bile acid:sodium symporter family protein [Planctomycetota bacterium]